MTSAPKPCAFCGKEPETDYDTIAVRVLCSAEPYQCINCEVPPLLPLDWNRHQEMIREFIRERERKAFEAGVDTMFNTKGKASCELAEHKRIAFADWEREK